MPPVSVPNPMRVLLRLHGDRAPGSPSWLSPALLFLLPKIGAILDLLRWCRGWASAHPPYMRSTRSRDLGRVHCC